MVRVMPDKAVVEIQSAHTPDIRSTGFGEFPRLKLPLPANIRKHERLPAAQAAVSGHAIYVRLHVRSSSKGDK